MKKGIGRPSPMFQWFRSYKRKNMLKILMVSYTENGRRLWLEVVPLYNNQSEEIYKIFSTEFTSDGIKT